MIASCREQQQQPYPTRRRLRPATMIQSVAVLIAAAVAYGAYSAASSLRANIAAARRSGLYYLVTRAFHTSRRAHSAY
jgi:hypothetical protein